MNLHTSSAAWLAALTVACGGPEPARAEVAVQAWTAQVAVPAGGAFVVAQSAIDAAGDVYVLGTRTDGQVGSQLALVRYDARGRQQWEATWGAPDTTVHANALAVDAAGAAWVAAAVGALGATDRDYLTARFDAAGALVWTARWGGDDRLTDWPAAIAVDAAGNAYVTGYTQTERAGAIGTDVLTLKYDGRGQLAWTARFDSGGDDVPGFGGPLAVDGAGNVYVAGEHGVVSYDADGRTRWESRERAEALALGPDGSVYTTAPQATLRFDGDGRLLWRAPDAGGTALAATTDGVVTTGIVIKPNQDWDVRTVAFDAAGAQTWAQVYDGGHQDMPSAVRTDRAGSVYVVGERWVPRGLGGALGPDCLTLKYDAAGRQLWRAESAPAGNGHALVLDGAGDVIVTGLAGTTVAYRQAAHPPCLWWQWWCK